MEIYNDNVYDLLKKDMTMSESLTICEDAKKDFYIKGVTEETVSSIAEIMEKIEKGELNRHYAQTFFNHGSSRSHTIFRLLVKTVTNHFIRNFKKENCEEKSDFESEDKINNENVLKIFNENDADGSVLTESMLNFVDLAGSEKILAVLPDS